MEGTQLGPYRILGDLGSGGMGKVYLAEVVAKAAGLDIGTRIAVKVIHAHLLETPGFFQRFLREADVGRSVRHENVVRTYLADALMHAGVQQNFLVMEYVEGQTLRDLLQELGRVPEELCRHIGREVAKGLAAIHEVGIIHRDLKPENVLITPDHVVKVMDLGVARLQDEAIRLSQTGVFVGSLEYAAPEQFGAANGGTDARADLHALGVVLYELATGLHPYRDDEVSRLMRNILDASPRKAGEVNPQLSPFFEEVVHTLLAKDREERFPSAPKLARVLAEGERANWWIRRAKALRVETKRPLRRVRIPRETALYGRDEELAEMRALYDDVCAGSGRVLLIEGEAGIGKTRLVDEFVGRLRQAGEDVNFLFGSYPPGGAATAAGAFSTAYREQFGEEDLETALQDYLTLTPLLIPAFAALLRGGAAPTGAEALTKESLQTLFVHATRGLAAERPTIVLIDDLHFAPEDGRALFASLALAVPGQRILLVGTMRPGVPHEWTAGVTRLEHASHRNLARLGAKDLALLLEDVFHSKRLADKLGMQIARKSDGNPFFVFEIVRGLREGQFITEGEDGTWVTTQLIRDIQVPSSVLDLVNARISGLTEEERDLLDLASCCGFEFDPLLVAQAAGIPRIPALKRLAQIDRRHRLVKSSGPRYIFDHHQVQEALYGSLPEALRREYHTAIAEALESSAEATSRDGEPPDGTRCMQLCEHHLKGVSGERARPFLDAALDHLDTGYLNDQAIALSDLALDASGVLSGEPRVRVLLRQIARLDLLGRRTAQREALEEVARVLEGSSSVELCMLLARGRGVLHYRQAEYADAARHYERSRELARELGDRRAEAVAAGNLGLAWMALGDYGEAWTQFERNVEIAREIGAPRVESNATGNLGNVLSLQGRPAEAEAYYLRWFELARNSDDRQGIANATGNLGLALAAQGRHEDARTHLEQSREIARTLGVRQVEANAAGNLGNLSVALGQCAVALEQFEHSLEVFREIGDRLGETIVLGGLGNVYLDLGSEVEAREHHERHLRLAREIGNPAEEGSALVVFALLADRTGDLDSAVRNLEAALAVLRSSPHVTGTSNALAWLGRVLRKRGEAARASACLEEALALSREHDLVEPQLLILTTDADEGSGDAGPAREALSAYGDRASVSTRLAAHFHLWGATREQGLLQEARCLLDHLIDHAPERYRESMVENVPLYRDVVEASGSA